MILQWLIMRSMRLRALLCLVVAIGGSSSAVAGTREQLHILGWLEHARIGGVLIKMDAKLDTGAKTSSIDADILSDLTLENGKSAPSVVFRISNEDGEERTLELDIVRVSRVKERSGGLETRPVVEMTLCIAGIKTRGEVSLADREHFNYPLLIGREMLEKAGIIVNPSEEYSGSPTCHDM